LLLQSGEIGNCGAQLCRLLSSINCFLSLYWNKDSNACVSTDSFVRFQERLN
jgi:hypothetical protein